MKNRLFLAALFLCSVSNAQERTVKVGDVNYNVYINGLETRKSRAPVVVFENGLGVGLSHWDTILDSVAKLAPVFAYDRSGVGGSDRLMRMPTLKIIADDLKAVLKAANIAPPYVVVGHSLGGVFIRAYAGYYPDEVVGLVFVDPADFLETSADWRALLKDVGVTEPRVEAMMKSRLYPSTKVDSANYGPWSETQLLASLRRSDFQELNALPLPSVPAYFFVGGKFDLPRENWSKDFNHPEFFKLKTSRNMTRWKQFIDSTGEGSSLLYMTNCGHFVHRDDPVSFISYLAIMYGNLLRN